MNFMAIKTNSDIDIGITHLNLDKIVKLGYYKRYIPDAYWAELDSGEFIYFNEATYRNILDYYGIETEE